MNSRVRDVSCAWEDRRRDDSREEVWIEGSDMQSRVLGGGGWGLDVGCHIHIVVAYSNQKITAVTCQLQDWGSFAGIMDVGSCDTFGITST